ncbi:hypothetical protein AA0482_0797 [Acetobacter cibinongensis NRIC 0482]|nr:hypothetical protein AA0482_0797 [Acetobacter cibinongensis NRIC 0482]
MGLILREFYSPVNPGQFNTPHGTVQRHWEGGILLRGWRAGGFRLAGNIGCVHGQFSQKMVSGCGGGWR